MAGPAPAGLVVRLVRWTLPLALLCAAVIALLGLDGIVLSAPPEARPTPDVQLNLTRAPALPLADDGSARAAAIVPAPVTAPNAPPVAATPGCVPPPVCEPAAPVTGLCCP